MNATALLPCVELEPALPARSSVILLHGLGADGHDFEPIVPELGLPRELAVRFVFPHAPMRPVALNGGMKMRAWFDLSNPDLGVGQDLEGLRAASAAVEALVERENARGVPSPRIVLAGFSQGGALALYTALRHAQPLAGAIALSTWLMGEVDLAPAACAVNARLPVFAAHGSQDPMVRVERGRALVEWLRRRGHAVESAEYPIGHQVCLEEIHALGRWLAATLA
jgi:phospholipase/carboxylesterase